MKKVITYGTYDVLHYGHIRLLERAKALGDYLIVGVTSDDFDMVRGKINVKQPLAERMQAVRDLGIADEIIVEEYEGQKIDDIRQKGIDIFTVGSDWKGYFDYLKEYCEVIYLDRTEGVSSSEIRENNDTIRLGFIGSNANRILKKYYQESQLVNGAKVVGVYNMGNPIDDMDDKVNLYHSMDALLDVCDAVYIVSNPDQHYQHIKEALIRGKHVLCESPLTLKKEQSVELYRLAKEKKLVLMDAIKTAYSTAYNRLYVLAKSGQIGQIVSVDAVCTSLADTKDLGKMLANSWNSICSWGPTALLPIFQLLGTEYKNKSIATSYLDEDKKYDAFTRINFIYDNAIASITVGKGAKSEGELVISGTKGYIYVPAPWWKTDYFEVRFEKQDDNRRYFYQLNGEGIRYEILSFIRTITMHQKNMNVTKEISIAIAKIMESYYQDPNNNVFNIEESNNSEELIIHA